MSQNGNEQTSLIMNGYRTPTHGRLSAALMNLHEAGDITRKQLGILCDCSHTTIGDWFNGSRIPDLDHFNRLMRGLSPVAAEVIAGVALAGSRWGIKPLEAAENAGNGVDESFRAMRLSLDLAEQTRSAFADRIVTQEEAAALHRLTAELRRTCEEIDRSIAGRTARAAG